MAFSKIKDARDLNDAEVAEQILAIKRQLMELRMLQATNRLEKPHQFKHAKHRLGQLMMVEGERKRSQAAAVAINTPTSE